MASGSSEMDGILADRIGAAESALADWRGRHAQIFGEEVNAVLARIAGLKIALWHAGNVLATFPEPAGVSGASVRYQDEIAMGARVEVPVEPGVASAVTSQLRSYVTTSSGQDERFAGLAGLVNLEGVTAEVTDERPLNRTERQEAIDAGRSPADLAGVTVSQTEPVDPATLIILPRPQEQVPALVAASSSLNHYTAAVAAAFDNADRAMLATLAAGPDVLGARLTWLRADPRRWAGLTPQDQEVLIAAMPDAIGAMDGLPTAVRDRANRIVLQRTKAELRARLAELESGTAAGHGDEIEAIRGKLRGIEAIEQRLGRMWPGRQQAYLLGFSGDDNGRAIVAIGNPDYARNVATYIPGTFSRLARVEGDIERADRMAYDANQLDPQNSTSVIMWMDYDAPQSLPAATRGSYATNAAPTLQHFQAGLDIAHTGGGAHKTVLGHSYGTVVIGHATRGESHLDTDEAVFVASPGVGVGNVSELGVDASHAFATTAAHDGIRATPRFIHGRQPVDPDFGARVFESAPGSRNPVTAHSQYWDDGNSARDNMAAIITRNYDLVTPPLTPSPTPGPSPASPPTTSPSPAPSTPSPTPGPSATAPR